MCERLREQGSCFTPSPGLLLAYINSVIINGTCSPDLFVRNDYTIIMINVSDIQILDAKQQAGSEPRSRGVNSNFLSSSRYLNPVASGFKIDTNAIKSQL